MCIHMCVCVYVYACVMHAFNHELSSHAHTNSRYNLLIHNLREGLTILGEAVEHILHSRIDFQANVAAQLIYLVGYLRIHTDTDTDTGTHTHRIRIQISMYRHVYSLIYTYMYV